MERTFISFGVSPLFLLKYYKNKIKRKIRANAKKKEKKTKIKQILITLLYIIFK